MNPVLPPGCIEVGGGLVGGVPGVPTIVVKYWVIFLIASDAGVVTWTM